MQRKRASITENTGTQTTEVSVLSASSLPFLFSLLSVSFSTVARVTYCKDISSVREGLFS